MASLEACDTSRSGRLRPFLYVLPGLALYAAFVLVPVVDTFRRSLFERPMRYAALRFVGLENFLALVRDPVFWAASGHNLLLVALSLLVQLPLALMLAVLLSHPTPFRGVFRTVLFAPMVMPTVAIAALWSCLYTPGVGLVDRTIALFVEGFVGDWLGSPRWAMVCVFVAICWRYVGFHMVIYLAGIAAIPDELYEAARLDGAGEWRLFRHVTLPLLRPVIGVSATLAVIGSLKYFDLAYLMAEGAGETGRELLATYVFRLGIQEGRDGYGSAVAVVLFVVAFASAVAMRRLRGEGRA